MINAQLKIIPLIFDIKYGKYKILSLNPDTLDMPNLVIEPNMDITNTLEYLLSIYIESHNTYHNFKIIDMHIDNASLYIYYIVFVTHDTTIKNSYLLDIGPNTILPPNAKKIIQLL